MTVLRANLDRPIPREHLENLALAQLTVIVLALVALALQAT